MKSSKEFLKIFVVVLFSLLIAACGVTGSTSSSDGDDTSDSGDSSGETDSEVSAEVAAVELSAFQLVNQERENNGLDALTRSSSLNAVARAHSQDMIDRGFFDHVNPDGEYPNDRADDAGISYTAIAENIAFNQGYVDPATAAVEGWMESSGHRANILDESNYGFTETGMGVAVDPTDDTYYFTQLFLTP